jgi:hypothetical protein
MALTPGEITRVRKQRVAVIIGITVVVEVMLAVVGHLAPAMKGLLRPVYIIVALSGAVSAWRAVRRRPKSERRRADRRTD